MRPLLSRYFPVGGDHVIAVHGDSRQSLALIDFANPCDIGHRSVCAELFILSGSVQARRSSGTERVAGSRGISECRSDNSLFIDWYGKAQAVISLETPRAIVTSPFTRRLNPEFLSKMVIRPVLDRLLERSFLLIHAAGVSHDGNALIITGRAGSGKSTLLSELLAVGLDFLADDRVVASRDNPCRMLRYPEHIRHAGSRLGPKQRLIPVANGAEEGTASSIIFLEFTGDRLQVTPLSPAVTAARLVQHVTVRDKGLWNGNLDAIAGLCGQSEGYLFSGWGGSGERLNSVLGIVNRTAIHLEADNESRD